MKLVKDPHDQIFRKLWKHLGLKVRKAVSEQLWYQIDDKIWDDVLEQEMKIEDRITDQIKSLAAETNAL